jgi:tetratricopeptide (TPR) repeat protein
MAGKIFINYRREDSIGTAGRVHDRLARAFGRKNLFVDVVGADLETRLNQVAACQAFLTVISPNWLDAKNESGRRRLDDPDDFIAIEIATALARKIHIVPVLVDGADMPRTRELPESLKPLARNQSVEVRQDHFDQDLETLVETVRAAPVSGGSAGLRSRRRAAMAYVAVAAGLLLVGWIGLHRVGISGWPPWAETREAGNAKALAEAEAKRTGEEAEQQRLAALKAEQDYQARALAEAEARRKSEEAEQQRVAALKAEEERKRAEAETRTRYSALISQGSTDFSAGDHDRAIATFSEAIRLNPTSALAFRGRGNVYAKKGDTDRAIADFNEAIRLDPTNALALSGRGVGYANKGDNDRAIADFNEAIRLDPKNAVAFRSRGDAFTNKGDNDRAIADYNEAIRLDPKSALALSDRGVGYANKGDYERALTDFNEAIRLDPKSAHAFRNRGVVYAAKGGYNQAIADFNVAIRLDPGNALAFCNRGRAKRNIKDVSANADIAKARQLGASVCR